MAAKPVFVDESGRRHRLATAAGACVAGVAFTYVGILAGAVVGVPGLGRLALPGISDFAESGAGRSGLAGPEVEVDEQDLPKPAGTVPASPTTTAPTRRPTATTPSTSGDDSTTTVRRPSTTAPSTTVVPKPTSTTPTTRAGTGRPSTTRTTRTTVSTTSTTERQGGGGPPTSKPGRGG